VAPFITADQDTTTQLSIGHGLWRGSQLLLAVQGLLKPRVKEVTEVFDARDLNAWVMDFMASHRKQWGESTLGVSSRSCSLYATTVCYPLFQNPQRLEYLLVEGQFSFERGVYRVLSSEGCKKRALAENSVAEYPIPLSGDGVHSSLNISTCPIGDELMIRTLVRKSNKMISLDFYHQHLAYMGATVAPACTHDPHEPLASSSVPIETTSVMAPSAVEYVQSHGLQNNAPRGMALTHGSEEAQFLACNPGSRCLHQGDSCLKCVVKMAIEQHFDLIIQS